MPEARVACETLATTNRVIIAGEVRGSRVDHPRHDRGTLCGAIRDIGYEQEGFHWQTANRDPAAQPVGRHRPGRRFAGNKDEGAGDQGIMFGYACRETPELMPAPIYYAHRILIAWPRPAIPARTRMLGPDAKSQVTVRYENGKPVEVTSIVVSTQHVDADLTSDDVRAIVEPYAREALPADWITGRPTGTSIRPASSSSAGPTATAGLTGRKIIVDTYGGAAPHGGGAFSGKDPTKVDRSAAYAARYLAKNVVAAGLADRCTIQLVLRHRRVQAAVDLRRPARHRQVDEAKLERRSARSST
jgi:S-adenosylmethionine synthetase